MYAAVIRDGKAWILTPDEVVAERGPDWVRLAFPACLEDGVVFEARLTMWGQQLCGRIVAEGEELVLEDRPEIVSLVLGERDGRPLRWSGIRGAFATQARVSVLEEVLVLVGDDGQLAAHPTTTATQPEWDGIDVALSVRRQAGSVAVLTASPTGVAWSSGDRRGSIAVDGATMAQVGSLAQAVVAAASPIAFRDQLYPLVRDTRAVRAHPGCLSRPLVADLHVVLALDLPTHLAWLSAAHTAKEGLREEEAFGLAMTNVGRRPGWVRLQGKPTLRMAVCGGNHEPSLLLDSGVREALEAHLGPTPLARLIANDLLYFTAESHDQERKWVDGVVAEFEARGELVSRAWLRWDGASWREFGADPAPNKPWWKVW